MTDSRAGEPGQQHSLPLADTAGSPVSGLYSIDRVTFANADTGYAVVHLIPADERSADGFDAVGIFGQARVGECYRIEGVWRRDSTYGLQVKVSVANPERPLSLAAIERYLAGASIRGMGPHSAHALISHFDSDSLAELESGGLRLEQVSGIGPVRARLIRESWAEHEGVHELMVNLQGAAGLTPSQAGRIYRRYGLQAWKLVSEDPYRLAEDVRGFGFVRCDRIGRSLGIAHDAPERIQAGILHMLRNALNDGHLWSPQDELITEAADLLGIVDKGVPQQVEALVTQSRIVRERIEAPEGPVGALFLPFAAHTEKRIADRLAALLQAPADPRLYLSAEEATALAERVGNPELTGEQRDAISGLLGGARLVVLTGGPGTGKTTTVRSLIACLEALGVSYALCATTGRAGKQLALSTDRPAATVHRHMGLGIASREIEPLRETILVIDEASMIDIWLLDEVLARLTEKTHLFLVGDVDQLPSVGPGAVLQDLIAAGDARMRGIRIARLSEIFRQEAGERSLIVMSCHRVRRGERPLHAVPKNSDYYEMFRGSAKEARELAVALAAKRLPEYLDVPPSEVQVLAPMHGGEAGVRALNIALQAQLSPPAPGTTEIRLSQSNPDGAPERILRVGDKVRQTRNDYRKQIYNGDIGQISHIDPEGSSLTVCYDDRLVPYALDELDDLVHAWAMTVHAAQGAQWPAVVIIMLKGHYVMLERNILYTAISRAQRLAVLVTQDAAVRIAVGRDDSTQRRTRLLARLDKQ